MKTKTSKIIANNSNRFYSSKKSLIMEFKKWCVIRASVGGVLACEWRASVGDVGGMHAWVTNQRESRGWRASLGYVGSVLAWVTCLCA